MTLISTKTVLIYDEMAQEPDGPKQFVREYDEHDDRADYCIVIPKSVWDDLEQPTTITLTIEPDDQLNGDTA